MDELNEEGELDGDEGFMGSLASAVTCNNKHVNSAICIHSTLC